MTDWKLRLTQLCSDSPPTDEDAISEIEQALREPHTTRLVLEVARDQQWLQWLNQRHYLDALFKKGELSQRDEFFISWVTLHFVLKHSNLIFQMISEHGGTLNPLFWHYISRELGNADDKLSLDDSIVKRWVSVLLSRTPETTRTLGYDLLALGEKCAKHNLIELTLKVFMAMCQPKLDIDQSWIVTENRPHIRVDCSLIVDYWTLNQIWSQYLKPNLSSIAASLLSGVVARLQSIYTDLAAWNQASIDWDQFSFNRSAIEPHEQDRFPKAIDVLIDAARDALELLGQQAPMQLSHWIEELINSETPILRRLAIHGLIFHPNYSPDERLFWLTRQVDIHQSSLRHEVYRAVLLNYLNATDSARQTLIDNILAHTKAASEDHSAEIRTAGSHFDWLSWLLHSKPDCDLAGAALAPIKANHPDWKPSEHPDLHFWMGDVSWGASEDECTEELSANQLSKQELLDLDSEEKLDALLILLDKTCSHRDRKSLLTACVAACKENPDWALALADVLRQRGIWSSDLWPVMLEGVIESELTKNQWLELMPLVATPELHATQHRSIIQILHTLVKNGGKPFALELLDQAHNIAMSIWSLLEAPDPDLHDPVRMIHAIQSPFGLAVFFCINCLNLLSKQKSEITEVTPDTYWELFKKITENQTSRDVLGCCVLANNTAFLFSLNRDWTRHHLFPLFKDEKTLVNVWDALLLSRGRFNKTLINNIVSALIAALPKLPKHAMESRATFIEYCTLVALHCKADPTKRLIPVLFNECSADERLTFTSKIGEFLSHLSGKDRQRIWERWLRRYWENRVDGIPATLDDKEVVAMLDWLLHLEDAFPEAVKLLICCPKVHIEHVHISYSLPNSPLLQRYPVDVAELLIYLAGCSQSHFTLRQLVDIKESMPAIPDDISTRLNEAFLYAGI